MDEFHTLAIREYLVSCSVATIIIIEGFSYLHFLQFSVDSTSKEDGSSDTTEEKTTDSNSATKDHKTA